MDWWQDVISTSDVALYIGIGAYRAAEAEPGDIWYGTAELERQLEMLDNSIDIQGEVFFSYSSLMDVQGCSDFLAAHYEVQDSEPSTPITEDTGKQASLLDYVTRFIVSLFY